MTMRLIHGCEIEDPDLERPFYACGLLAVEPLREVGMDPPIEVIGISIVGLDPDEGRVEFDFTLTPRDAGTLAQGVIEGLARLGDPVAQRFLAWYEAHGDGG